MTSSGLSYTTMIRPLPHYRALLADGDLTATWPRRPGWSLQQRIRRAVTIERRWPIGPIVIWDPTAQRRGSGYLLDGHHRLDAPDTTIDLPQPILRDLTTTEPTYIGAWDADPDRAYLPVDSVWRTHDFLQVARTLDPDTLRLAEDIADTILRTDIVAYQLHGGTPADIHALCRNLVPGQIRRATLDTIADHARQQTGNQKRQR